MTVETIGIVPSVPVVAKGSTPIPAKGSSGEQTPYTTLTRYRIFQDEHQKTWWEKTGPLLGKILASAGYSLARQFEAMTFYVEVLLPLLGPYPHHFRSAITRSGLPLEFSVNYQQLGNIEPVVRIGFEPVAAPSGRSEDPFNQEPIGCLLDCLKQLHLPGFDDALFRHFLETQTVNAAEKAQLALNSKSDGGGQKIAMEGSALTSQAAFGFDLKKETIAVKGYTFPALKCHASGQGFGQLLTNSIQPLKDQMGAFPSFDMVNAYLEETNGYSQFAFWSFDCVDSYTSRLKLYSSHNEVVWSKIEEIWTLGGRAQSPNVGTGLRYLKELWQLVKLSEGHRAFTGGFDDGKDSTPTPMVWNYEMKVGEPAPVTKFYFPIHGESDLDVVQGVAQFLTKIGLEKYGTDYEQTVREYL
ncbi:Brevianamide F reverse prenyltransferase [Penicillium oxalicum]|uniref:Brevianamide F reverse prenyltransferase n=1 Tax=Penicillium oxalicum TaxID=69781 RepID=UPI0020B7D793|nr:Brevianamide F reverse prenyltransferase [Penicillium oxalicum]KAI2791382.1 Brevianamide F reverse prenyltransferase [Penicillium oxalicum]